MSCRTRLEQHDESWASSNVRRTIRCERGRSWENRRNDVGAITPLVVGRGLRAAIGPARITRPAIGPRLYCWYARPADYLDSLYGRAGSITRYRFLSILERPRTQLTRPGVIAEAASRLCSASIYPRFFQGSRNPPRRGFIVNAGRYGANSRSPLRRAIVVDGGYKNVTVRYDVFRSSL